MEPKKRYMEMISPSRNVPRAQSPFSNDALELFGAHPQHSTLHINAQRATYPETNFDSRRSYMMNSFFAKKLAGITIFIALIDILAIVLFYTNTWSLQSNYAIDKDSGCANTTLFALCIYFTFLVNIVLGLTSIGIPAFSLFSRTSTGVIRSLFLQFCELLVVCLTFYLTGLFLFAIYLISNGKVFKCWDKTNTLFGFFGGVVYLSIFLQITWFTRFREHVKMQLGCFKEKNQTGNIRSRVLDHKTISSHHAKAVVECRKKIFKAATLENMELLVAEFATCERCLGREFFHVMYQEPYMWFGWFSKSQKNPLHIAASLGNIDMMEFLIKKGIDINSLDKVSRVRFSTSDLFWYFISTIVRRNINESEDGTTSIFKTTLTSPLHQAVLSGRVLAVEYLLKQGADVNLICKSSYRFERIPPLFLVEHPEIVHLLIKAGANQLIVPDPGYMNTITVLELAYLRGNYLVCQALEFWGGDIALTPLHAAAAQDNYKLVEKLLKSKADPNCLGEQGYIGFNHRTPLHWAAISGSIRSTKVLLSSQADVNFRDSRGRSALHWAARHNHVAIVKLLLEHGADPHLSDCSGFSPLLFAAKADGISKELIASLIADGVKINTQLENGDTALHIAMKSENKTTALSILECGGDIMLTNKEGKRPIDCTMSTDLQFEIKKAAGTRDVMISYTHSHSEFALKIRQHLENYRVTTWMDRMDPSGIGGGAVWREEIARGIANAAIVLCILSEDYSKSEWCLKELAYAKEVGTPVMAISCENVTITEELQVYLYTRQIIPFQPAVIGCNNSNLRNITFEYDEDLFSCQFRLMLDGVRDEIEKRRKIGVLEQNQEKAFLEYSLANKTFLENSFVFLSHGDYHASFVRKLYDSLTANGITCYVDWAKEDVEMKDRIKQAKDRILKCSAFIVVLSDSTSKSELVHDQLAFAEDKQKLILPILLSSPQIGQAQQYTLSRNEIYHFSLELGFASSFERLFNAIHRNDSIKVTPNTLFEEERPSSFSAHAPINSPFSPNSLSFGGLNQGYKEL